MEKTENGTLPESFIQPHYALIAALLVLLDKSHLTHAVKTHCKVGLKIIGIIQADAGYDTGTDLLLKKEFDGFYSFFPAIYFNNRALVPPIMIIENIELCIKTNKVNCVDS